MVSHLRLSNCTIIYELPRILTDWIGQVNDLLSVSCKDIDLSVLVRSMFCVNDLRSLLEIGHILDDGLNIIDRIDAEVLDQGPLGFSQLPHRKNGLEPRPDSRQHYASNHAQEILIGEDIPQHGR